MKKYERMTRAELFQRIMALEKAGSSASMVSEHERLNHELQVHQLKLEAQNRELRETQQLLEVSRNRYADLYDFAPVGYATFNARGVIIEINLTAAGMLGVERSRLLGAPFRLHVLNEDLALFRQHLRKRSSPELCVRTEFHIVRKDRPPFPVSMQSVAFYDEERDEEVYRGAINDITARVQAEQAERKTSALNQGILSSLMAHIAVLDKTGDIIAVNESWNRFARENGDTHLAGTGVGTNYLRVCETATVRSAKSAKEALEGIQNVLNRSIPHFRMEYPCHSPKEPRWFLMNVTPLAGADRGAVVSHVNITTRKLVEEALKDQEARMSAVLQTAVDGIITIDENGLIESFNPAAERLFRYPAREVIGRNISTLMPSPYREEHDQYLSRYRKTGKREILGIGRELTGRRKDGSLFPIELGIGEANLSGRRLFTGFVRDISERKATQNALTEERDFISAVLETAGALVIVLDANGQVVRFNRACEQLTGHAAQDIVGKNFWELKLPVDDMPATRSEFDRLLKTQSPVHFENYWRTTDGQRRLISWSNTVLANPDGTVKHVIGTGVDISERKEAHDALQEQTLRYQSLLDVSPDAIYVVRNGLIEFTNPEGIRLLGLRSADQVLGKSPFEFFKGDREEIIRQRIDTLSGEGKGVGVSPLVEERLTRLDGSTCWVAVSSAMFTDNGETALLLVLRDITDHKRLENEILEIGDREQQNLGHELHDGLGQQLTALEMKLFLLTEELSTGNLSAIREQLQEEVRRISTMLRECITLTRSLSQGLTTINLKAEALTDSLGNLATNASVDGRVECRFECDSPPNIENSQTARHLYRIAQEAVNNALKHARAKHIQITLAQRNNQLLLRVRDDGTGLPRVRKTTSGMGLEIMHHRANTIGASLEVISKRGEGVTIDCTLPLQPMKHEHD